MDGNHALHGAGAGVERIRTRDASLLQRLARAHDHVAVALEPLRLAQGHDPRGVEVRELAGEPLAGELLGAILQRIGERAHRHQRADGEPRGGAGLQCLDAEPDDERERRAVRSHPVAQRLVDHLRLGLEEEHLLEVLLELSGPVEEEREPFGIVGVGQQLALLFPMLQLERKSFGDAGAQFLRHRAVADHRAAARMQHPRAGVLGGGEQFEQLSGEELVGERALARELFRIGRMRRDQRRSRLRDQCDRLIEDAVEISRQRRRDRHRVERVRQRRARNALAQKLHPPGHAERAPAQTVEGQRLAGRGLFVRRGKTREDLQIVPGVVRRVDVLGKLEAQIDFRVGVTVHFRERDVHRPLDAAGVVGLDLQALVGGRISHRAYSNAQRLADVHSKVAK